MTRLHLSDVEAVVSAVSEASPKKSRPVLEAAIDALGTALHEWIPALGPWRIFRDARVRDAIATKLR